MTQQPDPAVDVLGRPERRPSTPAFDAATTDAAHPMVVVTTVAKSGERAGCLVGHHSRVSDDPPLYLVCLSRKNHTYRTALAAAAMAVHYPGRDDPGGLAELFGGETGDEIDKFDRCRWHPGPDGCPILEGVSGWWTGRVVSRMSFGDHVGFLLAPGDGDITDWHAPLMSNDLRSMSPGHRA